jgi:hypothetical protein
VAKEVARIRADFDATAPATVDVSTDDAVIVAPSACGLLGLELAFAGAALALFRFSRGAGRKVPTLP